MWDLPESGIKPVSPALAGRFFTTEGKHSCLFLNPIGCFFLLCSCIVSLFCFFGHVARRILVPWSGIESTALHWKPGVLATGSSQFFICFEFDSLSDTRLAGPLFSPSICHEGQFTSASLRYSPLLGWSLECCEDSSDSNLAWLLCVLVSKDHSSQS